MRPQSNLLVLTWWVNDAQPCLWSLQTFLRAGFRNKDLIPVKHTLCAAIEEHISVSGAIFLRLSALDGNGRNCTTALILYVGPATNRFHLSRDALIQLSITNPSFPQLGGSTLQQSAINNQKHLCECPKCTKPPSRLNSLPFDCTPTKNEKIYKWLLQRFSTSTFNQCSHQHLQGWQSVKYLFMSTRILYHMQYIHQHLYRCSGKNLLKHS